MQTSTAATRQHRSVAPVWAKALALLAFVFIGMLGAGAAEAQSLCTVTAGASRSETNVYNSGTLAHLRVFTSAGASDIFDGTPSSADGNPAAPAYACPNATLGAAVRFDGALLAPDTVNNRVNLAGASVAYTFDFDGGGRLSKSAGSTVVFYTPAPGETSRTIAGSGTLTLPNTVSQYPAGSHRGSIDVAHGNAASSGKNTSQTYTIEVTVVPSPTINAITPNSGSSAGGTSVTISGAGFGASGNSVTFGGATATISAQSATSITVTAPARVPGAVDVVVTTADGQTATAVNGFTYLGAPTLTSASPSSGPTAGGTSVTLSGTNLTAATAATFGGVAGTITANSGNTLTVTTPAGSGAVDIAVTTSGGTATLANGFTYVAAPTIGSVSPTSGPNAGATSVTITGSNLAGASAVTFGGVAGAITANTATSITVTNPSGSGTVAVAVTTAGGTATAANAFTYVAAPTISSVAPASGAAAGGTSVTITGTNLANATNVAFGGVSATVTANTATSITVNTPAGTGQVAVAVTTAGGVATSANAYTYIPTLSVTAGAATGASVGGAYSQSNPASGGTAPYVYAVASGALPAGTSLNTATGAVTGTPTTAGAFSYAIRASDSQGTPATATGATVSGTIAQGTQTIAFTSSAPTAARVGGATYAVAATSTSGLPVSFASATGAVCTVSGSTVSFTGAGTCTITADQAGDANYAAAPQVQQSFAVAPPTLSVTAGAATGTTVGGAYSQSNPASGGTAPYVYAVASGSLPAGTSLNTATGAVTGTPTAAGAFSYSIRASDSQGTPATATGATVSGTIAQGTQTIAFTSSAPTAARVGGATYAVAATSTSGLPVSFASTTGAVCTVSGSTVSFTGAGICTITADQAGDANYAAAPQAQQSFAVTSVAPTVSDRSGVSVPYNTAATIDLTPSISGSYTSVAVANGPSNGVVTFRGAVATYTPTNGYSGGDSFTYSATGPGGTSNVATVSLTVAAPPAPVVTPQSPAPAGDGSFAVDLSSNTANPATGYRITGAPRFGTASVETAQTGAATTSVLRYRPSSNFLGADTVTLVATGPGGESAPAVFTFNVAGKAPDLSAQTSSSGSVRISPTTGLVGGPFQGLRITRQPAFGTAVVSGLDIVFTPGAANAGATSLDYVVVMAFGESAPGRFDLRSDAAPTVPVITAVTPAGRPVTVSLTDNARGGPFTAAAITGLSAPTAGTATLAEGGTAGARTYALTFTPAGAFTGRVDVAFTLSNAAGAATGLVQITVEPRPDPSLDPDVRGLISSQGDAARRFARTQTDNFNQRLEQIRGGDNRSSSTLSLNLNLLDYLSSPSDPASQRRGGDREVGFDARDGVVREEQRAFFNRNLSPGGEPSEAETEAARLGYEARQPVADGDRRSRVGVWAGGSLEWGRRDAQGLRDTRFSTSGLSAGVDVKINDALIVGAGLGYGGDHARIGERGTSSDGQTTVGVGYGSWRISPDLSVNGLIGHGALDYDTRRWSTGASAFALGARSGDLTFGSLGLAYDRRAAASSQSIYGRMEASRARLDAFSETGAGFYALSYEAMDLETLTANLGIRLDWTMPGRDTVFMPSIRMEWRHEFEEPGDQAVRYADWLASPRYGVDLQTWSRDSLSVDLGGRWSVDERMDLLAGYRATVGSNASSHGLQFKLMTRF